LLIAYCFSLVGWALPIFHLIGIIRLVVGTADPTWLYRLVKLALFYQIFLIFDQGAVFLS